jgi:hypothetical protein
MKTQNFYTRRTFNISSLILILSFLSFSLSAETVPNSFYKENIKLNPDCKIKRLSSGSVIVFTNNTEGIEEKHEFTDFYADLLMAAYRKQRMAYIIDSLANKYYLSEEDCRREIKHAINILTEWNIVLPEDDIAAR